MENEKQEFESVVKYNKGIKCHQTVADCFSIMCENAKHGSSWKTTELAQILQCDPNTQVFGFRISAVNRLLETEKGFHLTTKGKNGAEYFVEEAKQSIKTVNKFLKAALDANFRAATLAQSLLREHSNKLSPNEIKKLEKQGEIAVMRYVLSKNIRPSRRSN